MSYHSSPFLESDHVQLHALFHYFLSGDSKQDSSTTSARTKCIIEVLQNRTVLFSYIITIWENTDGCADQYLCATVLYLLSILAHGYNIIIYHIVVAPGHGREVVYGLNATGKWLFSMLTITMQITGTSFYESQMTMHTSTANIDIILER